MKKIGVFVLLLAATAFGQVSVSPISLPHQTFTDASGAPCAGCALFSYTAGTTIPTPTFKDAGGTIPNTNPIVLSVQGGADIWVNKTVAYKFVLKNTSGTTIWTVDNVTSSGSNSISTTPSGSQAITQPPGTNFDITTSGGGKFNYNGSEVLNTATGVMKNPPAAQTVTQPSSTSLYINSMNGVANAMAFTGVDICAKIAAAIAFLPASGGTVDVSGLSTISPAACASNPFAANNSGTPKPIFLNLGTGDIKTTVPWIITRNNVTIQGAGEGMTVIHYVGTTDILNPDGGRGGIVQFYATPGGAFNVQHAALKNIHVAAGTGAGIHVPYDVLISQAIWSEFNNIGVWGAKISGIHVIGDAVADQYNRMLITHQNALTGDDTLAPYNGVAFIGTEDTNQVTQSTILNPLIEGVGLSHVGYVVASNLPTTNTDGGAGSGANISILSTNGSGQIIGYSFTAGTGYVAGDIITPTQGGASGARFLVAKVNGSGGITVLQEAGCGLMTEFVNGLTISGGLIEINKAFDVCIDNYASAANASYHSQRVAFDGTDFEATPTGFMDYGQGTVLKSVTMTNPSPALFGGQNTYVLGGTVQANTLSVAQHVTFDSVLTPSGSVNNGTDTKYIHPWENSAIGNPNNSPFPWSYKEQTTAGYLAGFGLQNVAKTDLKGIWSFNTTTPTVIFDDPVPAGAAWHMILRGEFQDNGNFAAAMSPGIVELSQTNNSYTTPNGAIISFSTASGKLTGAFTGGSSFNSQFVGTIEFTPSNGSTGSAVALSTGDLIAAGKFAVGTLQGFTGTKTAGACVLTITGGIITGVTGC